MKAPLPILKVLRAFSRRRVSLLLFAATLSFTIRAAFAAGSLEDESALQWGTVILSGILLPMLWSFRKETREAHHSLREQMQIDVNKLSERVQVIALSVARLEERDRITEMLDKRLPKE